MLLDRVVPGIRQRMRVMEKNPPEGPEFVSTTGQAMGFLSLNAVVERVEVERRNVTAVCTIAAATVQLSECNPGPEPSEVEQGATALLLGRTSDFDTV
jgi:hypothetical protein